MVFICVLIWGFFFHFIAFGLRLSGLGYDGFFLFLSWGFFFHFVAFGLISSGLGYDGYFRFFDLGLLFPFFCLWFKFVGCRLLFTFLVFSIWRFFFHFICFGLRPSGLGYDGFYLCFHLGLLFPFYSLRFKSVCFRLWWFFFVFFIWCFFLHFIPFGLSPSGLGYDGFFFCFLIWGFFFHFIACGLSPSFLGYNEFFLFLSWSFFFHFIAFGSSPLGLGYDGFFLCFWFEACFSILLPLV